MLSYVSNRFTVSHIRYSVSIEISQLWWYAVNHTCLLRSDLEIFLRVHRSYRTENTISIIKNNNGQIVYM